jgi:hypothetical protein
MLARLNALIGWFRNLDWLFQAVGIGGLAWLITALGGALYAPTETTSGVLLVIAASLVFGLQAYAAFILTQLRFRTVERRSERPEALPDLIDDEEYEVFREIMKEKILPFHQDLDAFLSAKLPSRMAAAPEIRVISALLATWMKEASSHRVAIEVMIGMYDRGNRIFNRRDVIDLATSIIVSLDVILSSVRLASDVISKSEGVDFERHISHYVSRFRDQLGSFLPQRRWAEVEKAYEDKRRWFSVVLPKVTPDLPSGDTVAAPRHS